MKAATRERYGSPEVVAVREVDRPELLDDGVLVRVRAASLNRYDWYALTGKPLLIRPAFGGVRRPKSPLLGGDFAGTVEAVGKDVPELRPGDEVFGLSVGTLAEHTFARRAVARKPAGLSFEEAAAIPLAGLTALQGLRDKGGLQAGQRVLVNGASGGVGTFAVQVAKALGAEVTAVCSTRNVELARSLGADHVVDYTREDFTRSSRRYDLLFDNAGSTSFGACSRVLEPRARVVLVGGPSRGPLGPLPHLIGARLGSLTSSRKAVSFLAQPSTADLDVLRGLVEEGRLRPVVERTYALTEVPDAFRVLGEGHAQGKLVVSVS
jgi:NADPH:quinone reductase-like Zn-dependent oxidoreductase